ncbi:MAG TPA: nucleotidyltransferase domain-containing protein [Spirochaetia bacterium]|nr:nucleotidyltransferase domain-containing protein [Spirochaetia bacterium]
MKTREEVLRILGGAKKDRGARYRVMRIALFGSYARAEQREDSDIDLLVDVEPFIGLRFVALANEIEY